jgi:hypothetical protein
MFGQKAASIDLVSEYDHHNGNRKHTSGLKQENVLRGKVASIDFASCSEIVCDKKKG